MANQRQTVRCILCCIVFQLLTSALVSANRRVNYHAPVMSSDEVIAYFKSFFKKSSLDVKNEMKLTLEDYAEDLYNKIEDLMSQGDYFKLLEKTRDITDRTGKKKYLSSPRTSCNPSSIFKPTLQTILKDWDSDKSSMLEELETWQLNNKHLPDSEQCNRFKGLTCQNGGASDLNSTSDNENSSSTATATCQCDGDPTEVEYFKPTEIKSGGKQLDETYPEGCYVKPWKPCTQLFSEASSKTILAQMIFPVSRTNKCKYGSSCLDLIPGMNKPICWCNGKSLDEECVLTKNRNLTNVYIPPLDVGLLATRWKFIKMVIPASDKRASCNPEYNKDMTKLIQNAGMNPSKNGAVAIMEKLVGKARSGKKIRICDFRKTLICDDKSRTCKQHLGCGTSLCAPNYICGDKNGSKVCLPDCKSPIFEGSEECSEDLVKGFKGRNLMDGVETSEHHGIDPAASHNEGLKYFLDQRTGLQSPLHSRMTNMKNKAADVGAGATDSTTTDASTTESVTTTNNSPVSNDASTESATPRPGSGSFGDSCQDSSDCDQSNFLDCHDNTCTCTRGLIYSSKESSCQIPTNEACGDSIFSARDGSIIALANIPTPKCFEGQCKKINGHNFCRPKAEDGSMFRSRRKKGKGASKATRGRISQSSKFLMATFYILHLAI